MITYHLYIDLLSLFIPCHIIVKTKNLCNTSFFFLELISPLILASQGAFGSMHVGLNQLIELKKIFKWFFKY